MLIFSNFLSLCYLWTNLVPENLKFSKLTEIWYKDTLLYIALLYDFNVYFFKILFIHLFLGKWVHCYMLITTLTFIFSKFFSSICFWANLVPKSEVLQIDRNLVQRQITIFLFRFLFLFFQFFFHSYFLWANLIPKSEILQID